MATSHEQSLRPWLAMGLLIACAGAALCAIFSSGLPGILWRAYLFGFVTCWPVVMGALGLLALGNLTGGQWAAAARPCYLAIAKTLPFLAILFVPVAFGLDQIYPWARVSAEGGEEFSPAKAMYLSPPFFLARAAAYFVVWLLVAWWLGSVSQLNWPPASTPAMRRAGAVSLVLLFPTATFAAFDWGMSLEPHWYSSIYGAIMTAGGVVAAHALAIVTLALTARSTRGEFVLPTDADDEDGRRMFDVFGDLGKLMLAFIMVLAYFMFSQFFIIWSANLPSEIAWYHRRLSDGWQFVALAVVLICFVAPFLSLLSRDLKRNVGRLAVVTTLLLFGFALNMYWTIVPAFPSDGLNGHIANMGALMGIGGLTIALYCWHFGRIQNHA